VSLTHAGRDCWLRGFDCSSFGKWASGRRSSHAPDNITVAATHAVADYRGAHNWGEYWRAQPARLMHAVVHQSLLNKSARQRSRFDFGSGKVGSLDFCCSKVRPLAKWKQTKDHRSVRPKPNSGTFQVARRFSGSFRSSQQCPIKGGEYETQSCQRHRRAASGRKR
jgi:hypothetical protein